MIYGFAKANVAGLSSFTVSKRGFGQPAKTMATTGARF